MLNVECWMLNFEFWILNVEWSLFNAAWSIFKCSNVQCSMFNVQCSASFINRDDNNLALRSILENSLNLLKKSSMNFVSINMAFQTNFYTAFPLFIVASAPLMVLLNWIQSAYPFLYISIKTLSIIVIFWW